MRRINPLGRIPSLALDDGEMPIDPTAILDWLDQSVGPERALIPVNTVCGMRAVTGARAS